MSDTWCCLQQTHILRPSHLITLETPIEKGRRLKRSNTIQLHVMCHVELTKGGHIFVTVKWPIIYVSYLKREAFFDQCSKPHTAIKRHKSVDDLFGFLQYLWVSEQQGPCVILLCTSSISLLQATPSMFYIQWWRWNKYMIGNRSLELERYFNTFRSFIFALSTLRPMHYKWEGLKMLRFKI